MMFCNESDEGAERIKSMQRMRRTRWRISLERMINGSEILCNLLKILATPVLRKYKNSFAM